MRSKPFQKKHIFLALFCYLRKKEEFALYLLNFRNELEYPELKKRISKHASIELKKKMQLIAIKC